MYGCPNAILGDIFIHCISVCTIFDNSLKHSIYATGSFRPTGLQFSPDGKTLYVAGVGLNEVRTITPSDAVLPFPLGLPYAFEYTGVIWKITHNG